MIKCSTDGKVTIIYGKNGDGKTTLHQLFQWIIYGQVKFNKTTTDHLYNLAYENELDYGQVFNLLAESLPFTLKSAIILSPSKKKYSANPDGNIFSMDSSGLSTLFQL